MTSLPEEIFGILGQFLTLKEILAFAVANKDIREVFLKPEINRRLADYYGFPYGLTFVQLKKYEEMSINDRMFLAAKVGDERIFLKMIELGADNFYQIVKDAISNNDEKMFDFIVKHGKVDFVEALMYAAYRGKEDMIDKIIETAKKHSMEITQDDLNKALYTASENAHLNTVMKLVDAGADGFDEAIEWSTFNNSRDHEIMEKIDSIQEYLESRKNM